MAGGVAPGGVSMVEVVESCTFAGRLDTRIIRESIMRERNSGYGPLHQPAVENPLTRRLQGGEMVATG